MKALGLPVRLMSVVARLLVLTLVVSSAGPLLHGEERHDPDCDPLLVVHDASQHRIVGDIPLTPEPAADHCAACHWARTFRSPHLPATAAPSSSCGDRLPLASSTAPLPQLDLRVPARAPPSFA